jgi:hypothetical protein
MKTPREILFVRHQTASPKLDAIRREVLKTELREEGRRVAVQKFRVADTATLPILIWHELIFPCRRTWSALAAVWILIFIVNFSLRDGSQTMMAKSAPTAEIVMSLQAQQRWMNELFADRLTPPDADRSRNFTPKPRSEKFQTATV